MKKLFTLLIPADKEAWLKKTYSKLGLNEEEINTTFEFDKRFSIYERMRMIEADISPEEVNDYPI